MRTCYTQKRPDISRGVSSCQTIIETGTAAQLAIEPEKTRSGQAKHAEVQKGICKPEALLHFRNTTEPTYLQAAAINVIPITFDPRQPWTRTLRHSFQLRCSISRPGCRTIQLSRDTITGLHHSVRSPRNPVAASSTCVWRQRRCGGARRHTIHSRR
jgi:hypothetical protein